MNSKFKKTLLWMLILLFSISTASYFSISAAEPSADDSAVDDTPLNPQSETATAEMKVIAENEHLILYFHEETTEIAVRDKKTKSVWYSNPTNRQQDTLASAFNRERLGSQMTVTYYNSAGQAKEFDNLHDSIQNKQFEVKKLDKGIKVIYLLGDTSVGIDAVPKRISKERMDSKILNKITDEKVKKDLLKRFKFIEAENVYERRDAAIPEPTLKRLMKVFVEVGYTPEDVAQDNLENKAGESQGEEKVQYSVPIQYELDGDNLLVTVAANEIVQPAKFPLHSIKLLEFLGAADKSKEGYIFIPDGSGSLIYLNNNKLQYDPYLNPVYGADNAIFRKYKFQNDETIRLPVFGLKQNDEAFFAIIENGETMANIEADISGRVNSYNQVYSSFIITGKEDITLTGGYRSNTIPIFQAESFNKDIVIRYGFLKGESANYSGMAAYYQDYLVDKYKLTKIDENKDVPFYLDLVGGITKRTSFLGIPYNALEPLTTYKQAQSIVDELRESNINHIKLRYTGWFNDGVSHSKPTRISPDDELGGKKEFKDLAKYLKANDVDFYPDAAFLNVHKDSLGFMAFRDASRFINRKPVKIGAWRLADLEMWRMKKQRYVLSPSKLPSYVSDFIDEYEEYGIIGLSLRDMGDEVNSDFRVSGVINRQEALDIILDQMKRLSDKFQDTLVIGGNAAVLPYANNILESPLSSSGFNITDESVPFYSMVLHGFIDYAGKPVNLADDQNLRKNLLKVLETGSNVYFKWTYAPAAAVKETEFDHLYSSNYKNWLIDAAAMYEEANKVLKDVRSQRIVNHEKLADNVNKTTYENGKTVIVNYNKQPMNVDGITVEAESYWVGGGKQ